MNYADLPLSTTINFRIPKELKEELQRRANDEHRSLGNYMVLLLSKVMEQEAREALQQATEDPSSYPKIGDQPAFKKGSGKAQSSRPKKKA